jgi:hypothetical protein
MALPPQFDLHAKELLARHEEGPFARHSIQQRSDLARALLELLHKSDGKPILTASIMPVAALAVRVGCCSELELAQ